MSKALFLAIALPAIALTVFSTGYSTWQWETSPIIGRLKHWNDPIAARVGDMPIYSSQVRDYFRALPKADQDRLRAQNDIDALLLMTINSYLWRKAALEHGALRSAEFKARLETAQNNAFQQWVMEDDGASSFQSTEADLQEYIRSHPQFFPEKHAVTFLEEHFSPIPVPPTHKKKAHDKRGSPELKLLKSSKESGYYFGGSIDPIAILKPLPIGKPSPLMPCGKDLCRYTKVEDALPPPTTDLHDAEAMVLQQKKSQWIETYRGSQGPIVSNKEALLHVFDR
jgi:hypothetical protein